MNEDTRFDYMCCVVLCCVVLWCFVLCCVVLCYIVLHSQKAHVASEAVANVWSAAALFSVGNVRLIMLRRPINFIAL